MANKEAGHRQVDISKLTHKDIIDPSAVPARTDEEFKTAQKDTAALLLAELNPRLTPEMIQALIESGSVI